MDRKSSVLSILVVLVLGVNVCQSLNPADFWQAPQRVINGTEAIRGQFPYQAAVWLDDVAFCGAALVSESWLVLAGHCLEYFDVFTVNLGAHKLSAQEPGRVVIVSTEKYVHPNYTLDPVEGHVWNDISILRLPVPANFSEYIQPISLPPSSMAQELFVGMPVRVGGWGVANHTTMNYSDVLMYLESTVISNEECNQIFSPGTVIDTNICAKAEGKTTCGGDSGSPLVLLEGGQPTMLVGVDSFGLTQNCTEDSPTGFARVTSFLDWIRDVTGIQT